MLDLVAMFATRPSAELAGEELDAESEMRGIPTNCTTELSVFSHRRPGFGDVRVAIGNDGRFDSRAEKVIALSGVTIAMLRL
jgi:hypothetical protein